ncbi:hypothetical protein VTK73DRAFT_10019 [Phialemonium thermophilum]|uniref:Uncharacterized protein n=1 Tax=Phialemonium thermophilum TaxID=223376 RepID=A0ABR3Y5K5_9PEZI
MCSAVLYQASPTSLVNYLDCAAESLCKPSLVGERMPGKNTSYGEGGVEDKDDLTMGHVSKLLCNRKRQQPW